MNQIRMIVIVEWKFQLFFFGDNGVPDIGWKMLITLFAFFRFYILMNSAPVMKQMKDYSLVRKF